MLQYLHINNWFDISQSLLLAAIWVIFPEHWNHFLFLICFHTFSFYFLAVLSSLSFRSHSLFSRLITYWIFVFMCVLIRIYETACMNLFKVGIYLLIYHQHQCVFGALQPTIHCNWHMICMSQIPVCYVFRSMFGHKRHPSPSPFNSSLFSFSKHS